MAIFNPEPQGVQIPDFERSSQSISQPKPDESLSSLFKGIGDVFKESVTGADDVIKEFASSALEKQAQPIQDNYVAGLQRIDETVTATKGQTLISADTNQNRPASVDSAIAQAQTLNSAKANGSLSETAYLGKLYSILKDVRSQYPGYTEYIDKKMSAITGRDVANDYLKSMISDINSFTSQAREEKNKDINQIREAANKGALTQENAEKLTIGVQNGTYSTAQLQGYITGVMSRNWNFEGRKQAFELRSQDRTATSEDIGDLAGELAVNLKLQNFEYAALGSTGKSLSEIRAALSKGVDSKQAEIYGQDATQMEANYRASLLDTYNKTKLKDGRSYAQVLGPTKVNELINYHAQDFAEIKHMVYDKDTGAAFAANRAVTAIKNDDVADAFKGDSAYYWRLKAQYKELGTTETDKMLTDHWLSSPMAVGLKTTLQMHEMQAGGGLRRPDGEQSSLIKSVEDIANMKGTDKFQAATAYNQLIDVVRNISNPAYTDAQKANMIKWSFDPRNLGLISKFEREGSETRAAAFGDVDQRSFKERFLNTVSRGQYSIYSGMTSPAILGEVKRLADKGNPELWNMTKDWARQSFGRELFFGDLQNFNKLQEPNGGLKGQIAWDDKDAKFYSNDKTPFVQQTLSRINGGLETISSIAKVEGSDVNTYMLNTLQELRALHPSDMITGLPQAMYDAVRDQKEAQKRAEEANKARNAPFKKDQGRTPDYAGSR